MRPAFIYSPDYDFRLPAFSEADAEASLHRFDGLRAVRAWRLLEEGGAIPQPNRIRPRSATEAELLTVHPASYLATLTSPPAIAEIIEVPGAAGAPIELLEQALLSPMRLAVGGTVLGARHALRHGLAVQLAGGYHHAQRERGGGFCVYNDLAVAIEVGRAEHGLERILVVDLDAHQGNGVESIYRDDPSVAVLDLYNVDIFPGDEAARAGIRWDHPLRSGTSGTEYLAVLREALPRALDEFEPQFLIYNAGTDIVAGDPLGLFEVEPGRVVERDLLVLESAIERSIPTLTVPGGGYTEESHRLVAGMLEGVRERWI